MRVALLGMKDDFNKNAGMGVQKYMFELYENLRVNCGTFKQKSDCSIEKMEFNTRKLIGEDHLSFGFQTLFSRNMGNYDIIHNLTTLPFLKPKFLLNGTFISTVYDFAPILYPELLSSHRSTLRNRIGFELTSKLAFKSMLNSNYIIADSTQTKDEAFRLGFKRKNIFVTSFGVDKRYTKNKTKNNPNNKRLFKVGYIGAMYYKKNLKFAIEAINSIKDSRLRFEVYGRKKFEYRFLTTVKSKNIKFRGFVPERMKVDIYDSFNIFVFPSLHEGFGLPILEAQARGLPVIIYKYGKIPKEVRKYCFEADSPEHMAQIIEDLKENGYNEKLKKKATEYARSFTWEKCARETLEVYKKVLEK